MKPVKIDGSDVPPAALLMFWFITNTYVTSQRIYF